MLNPLQRVLLLVIAQTHHCATFKLLDLAWCQFCSVPILLYNMSLQSSRTSKMEPLSNKNRFQRIRHTGIDISILTRFLFLARRPSVRRPVKRPFQKHPFPIHKPPVYPPSIHRRPAYPSAIHRRPAYPSAIHRRPTFPGRFPGGNFFLVLVYLSSCWLSICSDQIFYLIETHEILIDQWSSG